MNKRNARWISLILSFAVMVGSLVYIATGFKAETGEKYTLEDNAQLFDELGFNDMVSTDEDLMHEVAENTFVYTTVLDNNSDMEESDFGDVYYDIAVLNSSVTEGEKIIVKVSVENHTESPETQAGKDISDLSFDLAYDGTVLELVSSESNLSAVEFANAGSGANSSVKVNFAADGDDVSALYYDEMLFCTFEFTTKGVSGEPVSAEFSIENAFAALRKDLTKPELTPSSAIDTTFECAECEPQEAVIYESKGNNTLKELEISYTAEGKTTQVYTNPEFDPETTAYYITVPYNTDNFRVSYDTYDSRAEAYAPELESVELKTGINTFDINVTAQNGDQRVYTLVVRKLALDTLADPVDTLTKTVTYNEKDDQYDVNYAVHGNNTVTDDGKDYLISIDCADATAESVLEMLFTEGNAQELIPPVENEPEEGEPEEGEPETPAPQYKEVTVPGLVDFIMANTADYDNSTITVDLVDGSKTWRFTVDLSDPEARAKIESEINDHFANRHVLAKEMTDSSEKYLSTQFDKENDRYLFSISSANPEFVQESRTYAGNGRVYSLVELPYAADSLNDTRLGISKTVIDTAAAEFVFIIDFSRIDLYTGSPTNPAACEAWFNKGLVKSLFGYLESANDSLPGYVQQICDYLENDTTAKVTFIGIGLTPDIANDEYGVAAALTDFTEGVVEGSQNGLENGVYWSQTYILPQAENQMLHGEGEQNNLEAYYNSFMKREMGTSGQYYTQTTAVSGNQLWDQYDAAFAKAQEILKNADNANIVVLSPYTSLNNTDFSENIPGINKTLVSANNVTNMRNYRTTAYKLYEFMLHDDVIHEDDEAIELYEPAFNPIDNNLIFKIYDKVNRVFEFADLNEDPDVYDAVLANVLMNETTGSPINPVIDSVSLGRDHAVDTSYALPNIGDYDLTLDYSLYRHKNVEPDSSDGEHYYPLSETVNTTAKDENTLLEDIPTAAISFEAARMDVSKKMTYFADHESAVPNKSTLDYVLTYVNTGSDTLTDVVVTDSQILGAKDVKIYILPVGQTEPKETDTALTNVSFSGTDGKKGEATIAKLEPGQTIYVKYTMVVPAKANVTTGTSSQTTVGGVTKTEYSYIIDNTATATAKEFENAVSVNVKTEFKYEPESAGTTTTTTAPTTQAPVTTYPTTTAPIITYSPPTGESSVGYIVAVSLLFGALGVFGVTVYGMIIDNKIRKAGVNNIVK